MIDRMCALAEEIPVLSVTKGLVDTLDGKLLTYPDVWEAKCKELGKNLSINAIGGPCTSYELVFHDQTEVAFCGRDMETLKMMKEVNLPWEDFTFMYEK